MTNISNIPSILIDEYDYSLPDERIAKYPLKERDTSKLLLYKNGIISEDIFYNAVNHLPENSLLVYNNTKVIHARLIFQKLTGAFIEIFCLEPLFPSDYALSLSSVNECVWLCLVGNLKKWKHGCLNKSISIDGIEIILEANIIVSEGNTHQIKFKWNNNNISFTEILDTVGELPIPPYLHRKAEESDNTTYQTVYSKTQGSVAAPTAGLHFTENVLNSLNAKNINIEELTLHVGAGTFQPVKSKNIIDHQMHTEVIAVRKSTIENLINNIGNIIAVGTTSVRTLESLYYVGVKIIDNALTSVGKIHISQWEPYNQTTDISSDIALSAIIDYLSRNNLDVLHAQTQIIIQPGYKFRIIKGMFTNFHQPRSTLLLLVSAFTGNDWQKIYEYALNNDFRFLSYGDSSLLLKD